MKTMILSMNIRICAIFLLIPAFQGWCQDSGHVRAADGIEIVSHRGANRHAPENTFASARKAIEAGAAYIEIDVARSSDGVYYIIHDRTLDRTTNGTGLVSEAVSGYIDGLDAGSWFGHEFVGERVPRLYEFLQWIKGKAKVYFDYKDFDVAEIINIVYELGLDKDVFFWFSDPDLAKEFRATDWNLPLKVNAASPGELDELVSIYNPQIIECAITDLTMELVDACRKKGLKIMPYIPGNDLEGYSMAIKMGVDMVNLDNPDIFANMSENKGVFKDYKLITAYTGDFSGNQYDNEYNPVSVQEAVDLGYHMLQVIVRMTRDGIPVVHQDEDFHRLFNDPRGVEVMTWEQIRSLRSESGSSHLLSFEEIAEMCSGKIRLMVDIKVTDPEPSFIEVLYDTMEKYGLLDGLYMISGKSEDFIEKAKFGFPVTAIPEMMDRLANGEEIARHYFLFDSGNRMTSHAIKLCQRNYITVIASVTRSDYQFENALRGAKRDISFLKESGITVFMIDPAYSQWLPHVKNID
jgi:glycerophosphoryl diester phosphodiesterase